MLKLISGQWWIFAVRGVAAVLFGLAALVSPDITLAALVILFGAYAFVDGVAMLVALIGGDPVARRNGWSVAIIGLLGVGVGIVTLVNPGITALTLLYTVAFWAITTGVAQVAAAISLRKELDGEGWMALGGILSIVFGGLLVASPGDGLISLVWILGFWAMAFGVSSLGLAYRLRNLGKATTSHRPSAA